MKDNTDWTPVHNARIGGFYSNPMPPVYGQEPQPKNKKKLLLLIIPLIFFILLAIGLGVFFKKAQDRIREEEARKAAYCGKEQVDKAFAEYMDSINDFKDAYNIVSKTARVALSGPITRMQDIREDFANIDSPPCLAESRSFIMDGMDGYIYASISFMSGTNDSQAHKLLESSGKVLQIGIDYLHEITLCAPDCKE
jgi:hypothetical protein